MKRPKGPELKKPAVKVPTFVEDVYWDLRERGLLPVVGLILIAIVVAPFLLGADAEEPVVSSPTTAMGPQNSDVDGSMLRVVQAKPGLRDYHRRLSDRSARDPFQQDFTAPVIEGAKLNPETGGGSGGSIPVGGEEPGEESTGSPETVSPPSSPSGKPTLTLFTFAIKVSITKSGGKNATSKKHEKEVRDRVLPNTALPGKRSPVVTYLGPSKNGRKAVLLVSTKVESVFGDVRCLTPGEDICQLIEVEPGFPVVFVYGGNEVHYTINVIKIEPVVTGKY